MYQKQSGMMLSKNRFFLKERLKIVSRYKGQLLAEQDGISLAKHPPGTKNINIMTAGKVDDEKNWECWKTNVR